jgi:tripartite-type tricarboxylate transporter receptor subunit TctC
MRNTFLIAMVAAFAGLFSNASLGHAADYPTRAVRLIVPFSSGGAADVAARTLTPKLGEALGQPVVVENRPGAGSTIGAHFVARSKPDGYTLLFVTDTHVISASLYKNLPYNAIKDFTPIMEIGFAPNVLVVNPSVPAATVQELIALAKKEPGKLNFGSSGIGSSQHLFGALFMSMAGIEMTHIPYMGSAGVTTGLMSGRIQVGCEGIANVLSVVGDGKIRALAVTSDHRAPQLPNVPTLAEAGVSGYEATLWMGLVAPAGTPETIIDKIYTDASKILHEDGVRAAYAKMGTEVSIKGPKQFGEFVQSENAKWEKVAKKIGIQNKL